VRSAASVRRDQRQNGGDVRLHPHLRTNTLSDTPELLSPIGSALLTGYRYYSAGQIPTAQVIRRLRDLEMPVAGVKAVLAAPDAPARNALIAAHLNRLETELAQTRAAVESLRNLLAPPDGPAAIEAVLDQADILAWWQGALGRTAGRRPGPGPARDRAQRRGVRQRAVPAGPRPGHRVHPRAGPRAAHRAGHAHGVPAAELAIISHHGSLADVDLSYAKLASYATTHEISIDGPLREYYLHGAGDTPDEAEWRTEIGWPIFRAGASSANGH
jgi:DNA-binding transcriptional MerR regulator